MTVGQALTRLQELHPDWFHFVIETDRTLTALAYTQVENHQSWQKQEFTTDTETHQLFTFIESELT